jgi:protein-S-isoprenylcysteine O-methyltransferase Ste14
MILGTMSLLLAILALWIVLDRFFVRVEERMLGRIFGADWTRYAQRVRRWM